jgi:hypothetical protein
MVTRCPVCTRRITPVFRSAFDFSAYMSCIAMARALWLSEDFMPRASRPWHVFGCGFAALDTLLSETLQASDE